MTKLNQQKLPHGWREVKLGEIARITSGGTPNRKEPLYWNGNIPWITTSEIKFGTITSSQETISDLGLKKSSAKLFKPGTLLMAMYGQGVTRGKVAKLGIEATTNQACAAISPIHDDPNFLFYFFTKEYKKIRNLSNDGGQKNLSLGLIKSIKVLLPPLSEQNRLVQILECWDKYIESLDKKIKNKKNTKKHLLQNLLTGKKRLPGFNNVWKKDVVGKYFDIIKGSGLSKEKLSETGDNECILYGELFTKYREIIYTVKSRTDQNEGVKSVEGDILIPGSTTTTAIDLAIASTVMKESILLGGDINILRPKSKQINSAFYAYYFSHAKKKDIARLGQGITIVHLYGREIKKINIEIPELSEQEAIARVLCKVDREIDILQKHRQIINQQKKFLLNNLITGQIRVPEFASHN